MPELMEYQLRGRLGASCILQGSAGAAGGHKTTMQHTQLMEYTVGFIFFRMRQAGRI